MTTEPPNAAMVHEPLVDRFARPIHYLRLSVTDRCNFRCEYCRPEGGDRHSRPADFMTDGETVRLVRLLVGMGVFKVRLTGGEPLVRRDLPRLVAALTAVDGLREVSLSTNGHWLERDADSLRRAGLGRINVSLDTLDREKFRRITRGGDLDRVLGGIRLAFAAGLVPVKLNMVVMRGHNDDEIEAMVDFARTVGAQLRFIETMPIGSARAIQSVRFMPAGEILQRLRSVAGCDLTPLAGQLGAGPARLFRLSDDCTIGVISAVSRHFCDGCNRIRLTANGDLVPCLGKEGRLALRPLLRSGAGDEEVRAQIRSAVDAKPWGHGFSTFGDRGSGHSMLQLGG